MQSVKRSSKLAFQCGSRLLCTSANVYGRRSREPWDKRFPVRKEDVEPHKKGGSEEMAKALPEDIVAPTGVYHKLTGEYIHVPEMVPEFVVPDLTGFELKPYVSYRAKEIKQAPLTPKDIFNSVYAENIEDNYRKGTVKVEGERIKLSDGRVLNVKDFVIDKNDEAQ
ncbi:39S ribosomal protein l41, mitochondrial [Plakobranchus ocellatus]|uniref:39S ribosomal protein l41, mitochondrial n=1 Tax=Plakobranchus ocellatus TaxID=259542 RepID=A0AAV4AM81_9GAST|nr:39S ribosomal protein l41, mitochondrial [Plakobranchus ocellatus]